MKRVRQLEWKDDRGDGRIFFFVDRETGKKVSRNLYVSYSIGGREIVASVGTDDLTEAKRELKRLRRNRDNASEGKEALITPKAEKVTVGELLDANLRSAEERGCGSLVQIRSRTGTLKGVLGRVRAVEFRPEHVDLYAQTRRLKVCSTTVRRELEILRGAFTRAVRSGRIYAAPFIELPVVHNVSELEFPSELVPDLLAELGKADEPLRDLVEFISLTARRPKGTRSLTWDLFDREDWTLRVPPEKGGREVLIGLDGTLKAVLQRRVAVRQPGCDLIFHRRGKAMGQDTDRRLFAEAIKKLELPYGRRGGFTIYTVKSTAVGTMYDAGLSEAEIMGRSGHRTDAMLRRYRKEKPERAHAASEKVERFVQAQRAKAQARNQKEQSSEPERVVVSFGNGETR
jgi:integrase